jgi:predicted permease
LLIGGAVTSLRDSLIGARSSSLGLLLGAVFAFLLLACANLAALLGTRAAVRQRELSLRAALGAPRSALLRQSACEALLLVLAGGALGLALAIPCIEVAVRDYAELLANSPPRLDPRAFAGFSALLALTTLAGSLAPLLQIRHVRPMDALRGEGRGSQSLRARRVREVLLAVQVAATLALLVNAGLLIRSVRALLAVSPGFQPDAGVVALVVTPTIRRPTGDEGPALHLADGQRRVRLLYERLQRMPGAVSTCIATELPFDRMTEAAQMEGAISPPEPPRTVLRHHLSPGCFSTLGIRLLSGRDFSEREGAERDSVIVNRAFARQLLHTEDAVGQRLRFATPPGYSGPPAPWLNIVGMVDDVLEKELTEPAEPAAYFSFLENPMRQGNHTSIAFGVVVRPHGDPLPHLTTLPRFLREVLPGSAIHGVELTGARLEATLSERRALERVLSAFGVSALVLAAIGLFAVTGYAVAERSAELGIRRALGASRRGILWLVLRETGLVVALGVLAGLLLSWLGRGFLQAFLFQVEAADPLTYASVCAGILFVALLAALAPALAATRISPTRALAER